MTKPHDTWTVAPHGSLQRLGENLHTVTGQLDMPVGETTRRMTIARLQDGELVIFSPISLDEAAMAQLEALGVPRYMVVPRGNHRLDLKPWKQRYPNIVVVAPAGAKEMVEEVVPVDLTTLDTHDPRVVIQDAPGTGAKELTMMVETAPGKKTLAVADLIFNLPDIGGVAGVGLKVLGFKPGQPTQPWLVRQGLVEDEEAMRVQMASWARDPDLERILPAHGDIIENPSVILRELAGSS